MTRTPRTSHWSEVLFPVEIIDLSPGKTGLIVPIGTTADRPPTTPGLVRYNTTIGALEVSLPAGYQPLGGPDGVGGGPDGVGDGGSGTVTTVFGRTGPTVNAMAGDYTAEQITNVPMGNLTSTNVQNALYELQTEIDGTVAGLSDRIVDGDSAAIVTVEGAPFNPSIIARLPGNSESTLPLHDVMVIDETGISLSTGDKNEGGSSPISLTTGDDIGGDPSGAIRLTTGASDDTSGAIVLQTGAGTGGGDAPATSGRIDLITSDNDNGGPINIRAGESAAGNGPDVNGAAS